VRGIRVEAAGAVRTIVLARPHKRNALNDAMLTELIDAFTAPPASAERVCLIRAEGPAFCAGLDLQVRHAAGAPRGASPIEAVLRAAENSPLPVVAAVAGPAVAGGCELALAADLIVASEQATFAMPLARLGTAPTWQLTSRLVSRLGYGLTRELLLTGDHLPASRLASTGAVVTTPQPDFERKLADMLTSVAAGAPLAVHAIRATLSRIADSATTSEHADIDEIIESVRQSLDAQEGVAAHRERRRPRFCGR
jgi:enoyl-CoA hydratase/carnithine racemase